MKKVDKQVAEAYFRKRVRFMIVYLTIWALVSFGVVAMAEPLSAFTFNGMPFHYFMGAQGAILVFIALLFVNAILTDRIDKEFGIDEKTNEGISAGKTLDH
jgi:putative solute:sodium symporter small subunit